MDAAATGALQGENLMKKLLFASFAAAVLAALVGCASTSGAAGSNINAEGKFVITEDSGVVGYYTFEEEIDDSQEVADHSGNDIPVYTAALDGSELDEGHTGDGLYFNGNDEYITLDPSVLDGDGFTFAAWLNPEAWKVWARVLDIGNQKEDLWIGMDWQTRMTKLNVTALTAEIHERYRDRARIVIQANDTVYTFAYNHRNLLCRLIVYTYCKYNIPFSKREALP